MPIYQITNVIKYLMAQRLADDAITVDRYFLVCTPQPYARIGGAAINRPAMA
jgi:hypothetical protein